jgi:hypothetical protein
MYIDINTLFTFEVSKSDDQSILAAIVLLTKTTSTCIGRSNKYIFRVGVGDILILLTV